MAREMFDRIGAWHHTTSFLRGVFKAISVEVGRDLVPQREQCLDPIEWKDAPDADHPIADVGRAVVGGYLTTRHN